MVTDWVREKAQRSKEYDQRAEEALRRLSTEQLNWRPDKDTWSVAQQLQHLVLANRSYVEILESLGASAGPANDEYKPGFWGRLLIKAVGPEESLPAPVPKPLVPSEQAIEASILNEFLDLQKRFHKAIDGLGAKNLNVRFASPFAKFIKLKLGDAVQIVEQHNERHLNKTFKLLDRSDFPK